MDTFSSIQIHNCVLCYYSFNLKLSMLNVAVRAVFMAFNLH